MCYEQVLGIFALLCFWISLYCPSQTLDFCKVLSRSCSSMGKSFPAGKQVRSQKKFSLRTARASPRLQQKKARKLCSCALVMYRFGMAQATGYSCFFVAFNVGTSLYRYLYIHNGSQWYNAILDWNCSTSTNLLVRTWTTDWNTGNRNKSMVKFYATFS